MKAFIFIVFNVTLLFSQIGKAQENQSTQKALTTFNQKGHNMASISINGLLTEDKFFEYWGIRYGRFIIPNLSLGVEMGRGWFGDWDRTSHIGAFGRYYYFGIKRFSFFGESRYLWGYRTYDNAHTLSTWTGNTNTLHLNLGVAFNGFYKNKIGLECYAGYAYNTLFISDHPALGAYYWAKSDMAYGMQINFHF